MRTILNTPWRRKRSHQADKPDLGSWSKGCLCTSRRHHRPAGQTGTGSHWQAQSVLPTDRCLRDRDSCAADPGREGGHPSRTPGQTDQRKNSHRGFFCRPITRGDMITSFLFGGLRTDDDLGKSCQHPDFCRGWHPLSRSQPARPGKEPPRPSRGGRRTGTLPGGRSHNAC